MKIKILLLLAMLVTSISLIYADTNGVWHESEDIRGGIFAADEQAVTSDFTFINPVNFNDSVQFTEAMDLNNYADAANIVSISSGSTTSYYSGIDFSDRGNATWSIGKDSSNNFYIDQAGVDNRFSILSSNGNVGIGTLSPSTKLHVVGTVTSTSNFFVNSNVVWHSGNDGPGSGLNADTLDGLSSNAFITSVSAGTGLVGGGSTGGVVLNADTSYLQRRIASSCPAGSSIRAISSSGGVTCETDDVGSSGGGSNITSVSAGFGLTGGGSSGSVSLAVNTAQVQQRITASCPAGSSIRAISSSGTVTCETDDVSSGGGSTPTLNCNVRTCTALNGCTATCSTGYIATGGGATISSAPVNSQSSHPSGSMGWTCFWGYNKINRCSVKCCQVS